jgi:preprotein translocase subunit SecG
MTTVVLLVHIILATVLVGIILIQRSEGGGLGIGGGGGNFGGLMTGRGTANLLTRTTAILAAAFIGTSMLLAILGGNTGTPRSIIDTAPLPAPAEPVRPTPPAAPVAQ